MATAIEQCRPGAPPSAIPVLDVHGVGVGIEALVDDQPLQPGMVLGLHLTVDGYVGADTVLVTEDGPERLSRLSA
jgi:hypothetical protein